METKPLLMTLVRVMRGAIIEPSQSIFGALDYIGANFCSTQIGFPKMVKLCLV